MITYTETLNKLLNLLSLSPQCKKFSKKKVFITNYRPVIDRSVLGSNKSQYKDTIPKEGRSLKGNFPGLVGVPRMCRRFLKFAYVVVRECMGKVYSLLVRGVSRRKH